MVGRKAGLRQAFQTQVHTRELTPLFIADLPAIQASGMV